MKPKILFLDRDFANPVDHTRVMMKKSIIQMWAGPFLRKGYEAYSFSSIQTMHTKTGSNIADYVAVICHPYPEDARTIYKSLKEKKHPVVIVYGGDAADSAADEEKIAQLRDRDGVSYLRIDRDTEDLVRLVESGLEH